MTERERWSREERLEQQANRLELVSRWADDLAHEIKNPLHAMVINLELVKRRAGGPDPAPLIERAEVVESELQRVHELVDSLLRLVRPWGAAQTTSVDTVFNALLPVFTARARIRRVEYAHEGEPAIVAMRPGELAQVVLNLLDNALEATAGGGQLRTTVERTDGGVVLTVADTGPGLSGGVAPAVADPGSPTEGRSGLGLAVSTRLIERAGGTLRFESEAGGTRAIVALPGTGSA
ncbi:MAG: sensor histidine kinase [Gemmatimonadota bacterium]